MMAAPNRLTAILAPNSKEAIALALPSPRLMIMMPLAYFAAAVFAIYLSGQAGNIASLWFANAITLAVLLRHDIST